MAEPIKKIIQIVPALPPATNGLGDYAFKLALGLRPYGIETVFLSTEFCEDKTFEVHQIVKKRGSLIQKLEEIDSSNIFLNYVPYAYQKRGIPFWLIEDLAFLTKKKGYTLTTFFHEIFASSNRIWESSFWLGSIQKYLFKQLYGISEQTFTSSLVMHQLISAITNDHGKKNSSIGIFSNLPNLDLQPQQFDAVVFGSKAKRSEVYQSPLLKQLIDSLQIKTIVDIGEDVEITDIPDVTIVRKGRSTPEEAALYIAQAKFGLINYHPELLDKSGIYAAYVQQGIIPVNLTLREDRLSQGGCRLFAINYPFVENRIGEKEGNLIKKEYLDKEKDYFLLIAKALKNG